MKKETKKTEKGKQLRAGAAGLLFAAAVICYAVGMHRSTEVRWLDAANAQSTVNVQNTADRQDLADTQNAETETAHLVEEALATETEEELLCVYVCGAVAEPGVYHFSAGSRIWEAIEAAGGFHEEAAQAAVNLAQPLTDGAQIWIPTQEEQEKEVQQESFSGQKAGKVNLNTASKERLMTLTGIGEARAEAILAYRQEAGPFLAIEDIMKVSGIKEAAFQKIKDDITV